MTLIEKRQAYLAEFNTKELALGSINNRANFFPKNRINEYESGKENYCSIYNFKEDIRDYYRKEILENGITKKRKNSIENYDGLPSADYFIIDIDFKAKLEIARQATVDLLESLFRFRLDSRLVQIYFSGNKGFHIYLPSYLFDDFAPSQRLPIIHKRMAMKMYDSIKDTYIKHHEKNDGKPLVDTSIYSTTHLIRLNNTVNAKSGLYKIEMSFDELSSMNEKEIRKLATEPRQNTERFHEGISLLDANASLALLYDDIRVKSATDSSSTDKHSAGKNDYNFEKVDALKIEDLKRVQEKCEWFSRVVEKSVKSENIIHKDRISLAQLLLAFGQDGKDQAIKLFSTTPNFDEIITEKNLDSFIDKGFKPPLCSTICPDGLCNNMRDYGKKSPIAFAYIGKALFYEFEKFIETEFAGRFIEAHPDLIYSLRDLSFFEYSGGVYKELKEAEVLGLINSFLKDLVVPKEVTSARIKGLYERLKMLTTIAFNEEFNKQKFIINLKNGLFNIKEDVFLDHSATNYSTIQLNFDYVPNAKAPRFERFLSETFGGNKEVIDFVLKTICYFLIPDYSFQKVFIFYGSGRNGKGVLSNIIRELAGSENISGLPLHDIANKEFAVYQLKNKLLNISSELESSELSMSMIKRLSGGDLISADRKYKDFDNFLNKARLLILSNELPRFSEMTTAVLERFILIKFSQTFCGKDDNPDLTSELKEEMPGIFNLVISKFCEIVSGDSIKYEVPEEVKRNKHFIMGEVSSALEFIYSEYELTNDQSALPVIRIYEDYTLYCKECGYKPKGYKTFIKDLETGLGLKTTKKENGKVIYGLLSRTSRANFLGKSFPVFN